MRAKSSLTVFIAGLMAMSAADTAFAQPNIRFGQGPGYGPGGPGRGNPAYDRAYEQGYNDAYRQGYRAGYDDGRSRRR